VENPAGPAVPFPLPVDDSLAKDVCCVGREAGRVLGVASVVAEAELPHLDDEKLLEVLSVRPGEGEPASGDDRRAERLGVVNVVKP
jgi:hypothetical protein